MAQQSYPQTALLKQVKGVGTLIALTYMLTLEDPHWPTRSMSDMEIVRQRSEFRDVAVAHASARFMLLIASSISCLFLKPIVAQSTPAFWKANLIAFTRSS